MRLSRRTLVGMTLAAGLAGSARATEDAARLTVYSPAPAGNPMHALNLRIVAALGGVAGIPAIEAVAVPLPDSVNRISAMRAGGRSCHLPIVTTVDFLPARKGGGPEYHRYDRPNPDLYLVAPLYDVGLGIQVVGPAINDASALRGKRIAVPPRPSAVRLLTEALLRDGWGILPHVELVAMSAPEAAAALASGVVDATSWNLVIPGEAGPAPILPVPGGRYLPVDAAVLERIHAANAFRTALVRLLPGPPLLSFAQGLAAWCETPDDVVGGLAAASGFPLPQWPGLSADAVHPAIRSAALHGPDR